MPRSIGLLMAVMVLLAGPALAAPKVFVTIAPQKYFVDKVSGGTASVSVMVEPGANYHAYEPKPRQMAELAEAHIYFTIDDSFDQTWLKRIVGTSPGITVVNTAEGIEKMPMVEHEHGKGGHQHGHDHAAKAHGHKEKSHGHGEGEHDHGSLDPHIWLDPALVKVQVGHIRDGLSRVDPAGTADYAANAAAFMAELDRLDAEIHSVLDVLPQDRRTFLVFHPSWGYFARAYGLRQASIEVEGKEPSARDMARIIAAGKENGVRVVFVQPQFSEKSAGVIAKQIDAKVVHLDPLAPDWSVNLRRAAQAFVEALR